MARRSSRSRRLLRQAQLAASVQVDPQYSALRLLLSQAGSDYHQGVAQARGGAQLLRAAAHHAEPAMAGYFTGANQAVQRNLASVGINPATVGGPAQADIADTLNRLAVTQAGAQGELAQRGVDAAAGANYQVENLGRQRRQDVSKIGQQVLDLAGQKGKLEQSTYLTLLNQAEGRDVTRRGQDITRHGQELSHQDRQAALRVRQQAAADARSLKGVEFTAKYGVTPKQAADLGTGLTAYLRHHKLGPYGPGGSKGKGAGKEAQSAINVKRGIQNALSQLKAGHSVRYLTKSLEVPPDVLQAATDIHTYGALLPDTVHSLRILGVRIPKNWLPNANTPGGGKRYQGPR